MRLQGEPAEIKSVHDPESDPHDWYVEAHGGGVMIVEPMVFGHLFIKSPVNDYEDLEFVARGGIQGLNRSSTST